MAAPLLTTASGCLTDGDTLFELLDGGLDPAALVAARRHLAACPHCRTEYVHWRAFTAALARTDHAPSASPFLRARVVATIVHQRPGVGWPR